MLSYCLKCRKNTERKNPKFVKTNKERIVLLSICVMCDSKKNCDLSKSKKLVD